MKDNQNEIWFDALLKVAISESLQNELDMIPSKEELLAKYKPSDELDRRIKRIINRGKVKKKINARMIRKVAACIIIVFVASSITLLSVSATRNAIFNAFIEGYEKYTKVEFKDSSTDNQKDNVYNPTYLPEGFKEISTQTYGGTVLIKYSNDAGIEILFEQRSADNGTSLVDNENTECKEIDINGNIAYLFEAMTKDDYSVLLWQSEGIVFELTSQISSDELIKIGSTMKK